MRLFSYLCCFVSLCAGLAEAQVSGHCRPSQRRVTVSDAIMMTRLGVPSYMDDPSSNVAQFSPDGRRFALVLKRGDIERNTNNYILEIFRTEDALSSKRPEAIVRMASNSNRDGIGRVKWLRDSHTLLFLGEKPDTDPQIYSFDLETRKLKGITHHATPIVSFDASDDGRVIVFEAAPTARDGMDTPEVRRTGFHVTGEGLSEVLLSGSPYGQYRSQESQQLFLMTGDRIPRQIFVNDCIWPILALSVSPNGQYALVEALVRDVPKGWLGYKDRLLHEFVAAEKAHSAFSSVEQYLLLDTASGTIDPLIDAPKSWEHDGFLWTERGRSIVLSRAYLPLAGVDQGEYEKRSGGRFTLKVDLPSRAIAKIADENLPSGSRGSDDAGAGMASRKRDTIPPNVSAKEKLTNPAVTYEQDMNTPPKIWITDPATGTKTLLVDPNPQFQQLCFAREEEIKWNATDGHPVRGGLYLPPDYQPGRRYPLVIQTHAFDPKKFWIDGPWSSAFAAQPLAAKDIVVLQMGGASDGSDALYRSTPEEAPRQMAAFEGAIDSLDKQGIIDNSRVGIIGFSRTLYHVSYTLTHSKYNFAAVTLADGFNGGYYGQVTFLNQTAEPNAVNGGPPYGESLSLWMEHSPAFNLANVKAPVRLESYGVASTIEEWEWFSLSSQMHKPIDFILLPRGTHLLVKPWERLASQQGNVDWFAFWLKGEEDPTSEKHLQYARWRELRDRNK